MLITLLIFQHMLPSYLPYATLTNCICKHAVKTLMLHDIIALFIYHGNTCVFLAYCEKCLL